MRPCPGSCDEEGTLALREINLIPPDVAAKFLVVRHLMFWAGCLVLAVGIVIAAGSVQKFMIGAKQQTLAAMQTIPSQLANRIEALKGLQRDQERLNELRSALTAVRSKSPPPSPILVKLSEVMNDQTWLTQLLLDTEEGQGKGTQLRLTGFSTSNENLGDFLSRLSAEMLFKDVVLKFASDSEGEEQGPKNGASRGRIRFEIACQIKRG